MKLEIEGDERRITLRLLSYWERKRAGRDMPTEIDINPADIADLWEYCFLIHARDVAASGLQFTYIGLAIEEMYRFGLPKDDERDSLHPQLSLLVPAYNEVVAKKAPHISEWELSNPHGDKLLTRQVLLPLGENGRVDAVFGGLRFLKIIRYS